ncbi:MAG: ferritin-like domain-containing protein [Planctomycetota bacterium]
MANEETIQALNEIFAEEVEAALRYLHLAVTIKGIDRITLQKPLLEGMEETMVHARVVAEKILEIGGVPSLDIRIQLPGEMSTGADAIRTAVEFEQAAMEAYRDLMESASGDVPMEEFARAQVALESEHLSRFRLLLED